MNIETNSPIYLCEKDILKYLKWEKLIPAIEGVLSDVTDKDETQTVQPPRLIMPIVHESG